MRFSHLFETTGALTLVALSLIAAPAPAQTVISNENLVTTTFVVNKTSATAKCNKPLCIGKTSMLKSIPVTCPAAIGQTCTFHIALDAKLSLSFPCTGQCGGPSPTSSYQFLIDGLPPTIGPTDANGNYLFARNVETGENGGYFVRQSYASSVITTVTNTNSNNHTLDVNIRCQPLSGQGGCETTAYWSTMRVDVFEP